MKTTRRQFLVQSAKAGLAVAAGVLGGLGLANRPRPTYEVPEDEGFTAEGWVRVEGWDWEEAKHVQYTRDDVDVIEWTQVPLGEPRTYVFYPIDWEDSHVTTNT